VFQINKETGNFTGPYLREKGSVRKDLETVKEGVRFESYGHEGKKKKKKASKGFFRGFYLKVPSWGTNERGKKNNHKDLGGGLKKKKKKKKKIMNKRSYEQGNIGNERSET